MFCYQCEQTSQGNACTSIGVCGKSPEVAALQDVLTEATKGISMYAHRARKLGSTDPEIDVFVTEALFATVTNVDFDPERFELLIARAYAMKLQAVALHENACKTAGVEPESLEGPAQWAPAESRGRLVAQGLDVGIQKMLEEDGPDIRGLKELVLYGVKGTAAYADHALVHGVTSETAFAFFHEALSEISRTDIGLDDLLALALRCGEVNLEVMGMLDEAHTKTYGHPEPTEVRVEPRAGKAILISGHELSDLLELLKQTEGKGINIYTHGEMLPAHGYPELKKFPHLAGNYGGAWQDQQKEFDAFPGAILMSTNCIQKPRESYMDRIFTAGLVGWPGVKHVEKQDFSAVIEAALAAPGFSEDGSDKTIMVGFGHNAVLGVADKVVEAVKAGSIRHFFLVGGCDGAKPGRNYYTDLAEKIPEDCVVLTLACGKYRFNKLDFGDIGGIPRLLDIGQCNDAFSAIKIASALAEAFETDVNSLPLSLILSWYEQKAVCILLTLLHLGIKNIRIGPSLPAFLSPAAVKILVDAYGLKPIGTAEEDLAAILQGTGV